MKLPESSGHFLYGLGRAVFLTGTSRLVIGDYTSALLLATSMNTFLGTRNRVSTSGVKVNRRIQNFGFSAGIAVGFAAHTFLGYEYTINPRELWKQTEPAICKVLECRNHRLTPDIEPFPPRLGDHTNSSRLTSG